MTRQPIGSEDLSAIFSALGHPARRSILVVLHARGGEMTAGEINDRFKHSWPTTTRHLGVLMKAGLVAVEERGRHRVYSLQRRDLARATQWLCAWAIECEEGRPERAAWADLPFATMRNAIPPNAGDEDDE